MSTYGNVTKGFLSHRIQNMDLNEYGGLKFLDDVIQKFESLNHLSSENNEEFFTGTKTIGGCFEGTYEIYTLGYNLSVIGRFDKFNLRLAIDKGNTIQLEIIRGNQTDIMTNSSSHLTVPFMYMLELFRK